jgi:UDP-N-acetylmuramate dehydrogenase
VSVRSALGGYSGEIRWEEPMTGHTSLGIGGPAEAMVFPSRQEEVIELVKRAEGEGIAYVPLGCGSNLLVRDGGLRGVVINLTRLSDCRNLDGDRIWAEGGMSYPRLSTRAQERGLSGLEFAIGIPGTVGGAVVMNAGIPDAETKDPLEEVTLVGEGGKVATIPRDAIPFGYRSAKLPRGVVIAARFRLRRSTPTEVGERVRRLLARRRETQPLSYPNVGSIFRNPPGRHAGKLIEEAGLKGATRGGSQISERHANFIVNRGGASAADVLALIDLARRAVFEKFGVSLEQEVRVEGVDAV